VLTEINYKEEIRYITSMKGERYTLSPPYRKELELM